MEFLEFVPDTELRQRITSFCNLASALGAKTEGLRTVPVVTLNALHRFARFVDDRERTRWNPYSDRCLEEIDLHFFRARGPGEVDRCFCRKIVAADFGRLAADTTDLKVRLGELCGIDGHPQRATGACYCGETAA